MSSAITTVGVQSDTENLMFSLAPVENAYSWKTSVSFDFSKTALEPATVKDLTKTTAAEALQKKDGSAAVSGTNYVQAQFFVRCSPSAKINFGDCSVTSSNVNSYSMLAGASDDSKHNYAQGASVKAAAGNALRMVAAAEAKTDAKENVWTKGEKDAVITTLGTTVYSLGEDLAKNNTDVNPSSSSTYVNFGNSMTSSAFANRYYDAVSGNTENTTGLETDYKVTSIDSKSTELFKAAEVATGKDYKVYALCLTLCI